MQYNISEEIMYKFLLFSALCLFSFNANALDTSAYDNCYAKAKTDDELSLCMKSETARLNNLIKDEYKYIIKLFYFLPTRTLNMSYSSLNFFA